MHIVLCVYMAKSKVEEMYLVLRAVVEILISHRRLLCSFGPITGKDISCIYELHSCWRQFCCA